jgi:hypothetical protein
LVGVDCNGEQSKQTEMTKRTKERTEKRMEDMVLFCQLTTERTNQ